MEKLQAALAKARSQREGLSERTVQARKPDTLYPAPEVWDELEQVELSDKVLRQHRIVSQSVDRSSGSFDVLRTKIMRQMEQNGWNRLAITSPDPASGKSTIACNLALGLSRQSSVRTMLVDLDLGDPSAHLFFGIHRPHSVSDILSGQVPLSEHAVRISDNVAVVVSPKAEQDPSKLILSDRMVEFLRRTQEVYKPDIMIFDLPAILSGDRARAFLKNVDCALIVAMADKTRFNHLDICEREVAESTNVLGVVLNGCNSRAVPQSNL